MIQIQTQTARAAGVELQAARDNFRILFGIWLIVIVIIERTPRVSSPHNLVRTWSCWVTGWVLVIETGKQHPRGDATPIVVDLLPWNRASVREISIYRARHSIEIPRKPGWGAEQLSCWVEIRRVERARARSSWEQAHHYRASIELEEPIMVGGQDNPRAITTVRNLADNPRRALALAAEEIQTLRL